MGSPVGQNSMECTRCGACCVAPDIAGLGKPVGARCPHLTDDLLCAIYEDRPDVCRQYQADEICRMIEAPNLDERVRKYLDIFGLAAEIPVDKGPPHLILKPLAMLNNTRPTNRIEIMPCTVQPYRISCGAFGFFATVED